MDSKALRNRSGDRIEKLEKEQAEIPCHRVFARDQHRFVFNGIIFTGNLKQTLAMSQEGVNYDIELSYGNEKE